MFFYLKYPGFRATAVLPAPGGSGCRVLRQLGGNGKVFFKLIAVIFHCFWFNV